MSTDNQLIEALQNASEKVIGRALTTDEKRRLLTLFNESKEPTTFSRAQEALRNFSDITESQLQQKAAASDDTDRTIQDLKNIADRWKR